MNKLTQTQPNDNISPFDSIKHIDSNGNEFWYARELQVLMGYTNWRKFNTAIEQAKENLELNGDIVSNHFDLKVKKSKGRNAKDFKLTRYASYMIALCCDGRKSEVAQAKKYFAIKTRQAEIVIPKQNDRIRELELELQIQQSKERTALVESSTLDKRHLIVTTCPEPVQQKILGYTEIKVVEEKEVVVDKRTGDRYDGVGIGYLTKRYGFKNNKQTWAYLESIGLGKDSDHWKTELSAVTHKKLERSLVDYIDEVYYQDDTRQMWLGE